MDFNSIGLQDSEVKDLQVLSRHREWTSVLKLIDCLAQYPQRQLATNIDLKENENNALKGEVRAMLRLYKWLRNLYDQSHK